MAEDTEARVKKVIAAVLGVDEAGIKPEHDFVRDLGAESVQSIELVATFEAEFDIEMDEDDALDVKSVGTAIEYIDKVRAEQGK